MAKSPADRYQSAAQFSRDLRSAQIGGPIAAAAFDPSAERTSLMTAPAGATAVMAQAPLDQTTSDRRRKRRRWPVVLLVVLLLLVIAAAAYGLIRAMGGGSVTVPPVVGLSQASAERALANEGFKTGLQEEYSDTVAKGFVSRQAPSGGTRLRKGETVDIWVSKGSETVTLSDFKGWKPAEVEAWLTQNDLVGVRKSGKSSGVASGKVYRQDPKANSDVKRGDTVTYWVSSGKPVAGVPDLSGLSQSDAQVALAGAGLVLGVVTSQTSTTVSSGLVISQDPVAGTQVDKGSAVDIVVSSGSPSPSPTATVAVPNVYGMNATLAAQQITDAGLAVAIKQKGGTGQPPGTVVKIVPDAGVMVPLGSTVLLVIAK
jgi:serine/threonine-protein kinase